MERKTLLESILLDRRLKIYIGIIFLANALLIHQLYNRMFKPSFKNVANTFFVSREPFTLYRLNEQLLKLEALQGRINDATFNEIQESLSDTVYLLNNVNKEITAKNEVWDKIKREIEFDTEAFTKIKTNLSVINSVTNTQMEVIKQTVSASYKPTIWESVFNYVLSFITGVLASIVATRILRQKSKIINKDDKLK